MTERATFIFTPLFSRRCRCCWCFFSSSFASSDDPCDAFSVHKNHMNRLVWGGKINLSINLSTAVTKTKKTYRQIGKRNANFWLLPVAIAHLLKSQMIYSQRARISQIPRKWEAKTKTHRKEERGNECGNKWATQVESKFSMFSILCADSTLRWSLINTFLIISMRSSTLFSISLNPIRLAFHLA